MLLRLPTLPCANILCRSGHDFTDKSISGFHITCIYCRRRRRHYKGFVDPKPWITYTYKSWWLREILDYYIKDGVKFVASNGGKIIHYIPYTLFIDPRGKFTGVRCAIIICIDNLMVKFGTKKFDAEGRQISHNMRKPFAELCEFFANYP